MKTKLIIPTLVSSFLAASLLVLNSGCSTSEAEPEPLKALLITGGCCHSYATQKNIIKLGLEARAHIVVDQIHTDDDTTNPPLAIYGNADYANGYDVVIHDECAAHMADVDTIKAVLAPHDNGVPGVNLHCSMHSYRVGDHKAPSTAGTDTSLWFDYIGIQSSGHGPKEPVEITFADESHPVTETLGDWVTLNEELYNNVQIFPSATGLANGFQHVPESTNKNGKLIPARDDEAVVVWTNDYKGTRVFSTTIGHYDETVSDARYLDLVTRGLLWSCDKLNDTYLK